MGVEWEVEKYDLEHEGEPPRFMKWLKWMITIFCIVLIVSYVWLEPNVRSVITGLFESSEENDGKFVYGNKTIVFDQARYQELVNYFWENQEAEFRACLKGSIDGNTYVVNDIWLPIVHSQTVFRVESDPCPADTIIDLHSHPYQKCSASHTDMQTLQEEKARNPDILMAVMCTEDRISFYG